MISLDDIEDMTCLTREEIEAVAEHDRLPALDASCMAEYLMHQHLGPARLQTMICEDIRDALHRGDKSHAKDLYGVLHHFLKEHPEAAYGASG